MTITSFPRVIRLGSCIGLLAALLLMPLAACNKTPSAPVDVLTKAKQDRDQGNTRAAIIELRNLLDKEPNHAEARYTLGMIYRQMNAPRAAEKEFRMALKAGYDKTAVIPLLAETLFKQGQFDKLLEETRSSDHGELVLTAPILAMRGHAYASLGNNDEAAASFDHALKRQPDHAEALLGKARLAAARREPAVASSLIRQAATANPQSLDALLMLADTQHRDGEAEAALGSYLKAYALSPYSVPVNLNLASIYLLSNRTDDARKHVEALRKIAPENPMAWYFQALLDYRRGDIAAAEAGVRQVLKLAPSHLPGTALAGMLASATGDFTGAERLLQQALSREPDNHQLRKLLAAVLIRHHRGREALAILTELREADPADVRVLSLMGEAYLEAKDLDKAAQFLELAMAKSPTNKQVKTNLGLTRLMAGDTQRALNDLASIANGAGQSPDALLASSLLSAGQYDQALKAVARMEQVNPRRALTYNLKGAILLAQHNVSGARAAFEQALAIQPAYLPAALNLAQLDSRLGEVGLARSRLQKVIALDAGNVDAMLALADLEIAAGKRDDALRWLERASAAQPGGLKPIYAQASLLFGAGDYERAIPMLEAALKLAPEHAEALSKLAFAQLQTGRHPEAMSSYSRLIILNPKSAQAYYGLALAQSAAINFAGAEMSLKKALAIDPAFPEALTALVALQLKANKVAEVIQLAAQVQKRLPTSPVGFLAEGDARMLDKRYRQAAVAFEQAHRRQPDSASLIKWQSALRQDNRAVEADRLMNTWLTTHPDDMQVRMHVADTAIKRQQFQEAAAQYELIRKQQPDNLGVLHNLIQCYRQFDEAKALAVAEAAHQQAPTHPLALQDLADMLTRVGKHERVVALLRKAVEVAPDSPSTRYQLVQAYLQTGEKAQARDELERLSKMQRDFPERTEAEKLLSQLRN
ncbi:XrtA/PEP-CTERM system TPR-repeat protein PrsT [Chitinivorax sp. B]|uniref:XrtA/PEP-CTERM system TPR-repeat protein PrsT n=1 Tax=Chitinivorax sp. B TaxID=2502235 RepID=UPI0014852493|nr:XrtA/PEP-CTERM system TPR-repeat protein PrsT [Chitinivorax sp. B]